MTATVNVEVRISQGRQPSRGVAVVLTVLFVAWVSGWLWWLLAAASLAAATLWFHRRVDAVRAELAAIAARADQQHAWVLAGDPRGTYGHDAERLHAARPS